MNEQTFLTATKQAMKQRGWDTVDFVLVTGDAYVDHPSFGAAIIGRILESHGYKVAILAQPDWQDPQIFLTFGVPKLGFLVTAGNLDSMVSHYTVNKKKRHRDVYTPGGQSGKRPDRATIVYCGKIREVCKNVPIIIGGIEASLRRFAHYDYWQNKVRRSILFDSRADLLVYGMGEKAILEIADSLNAGIAVDQLTYIRGTACITKDPMTENVTEIPSYETICQDKVAYAKAAQIIQGSNDPFHEVCYQQACSGRYLIQNPPQMPLSEAEMDALYALPFTYEQHPSTLKEGAVPGLEEVKFSITANRGCFGSCSFCALAIHQGRYVQKRSQDSIVSEAKRMTQMPDFKGYIHDIGGPTANFRNPACEKQKTHGVCRHRECLYPTPCKNLDADESDYLEILKAVRSLPEVKKVFVRSGIRYDFMLKDKTSPFFKELVKHHVSGQLRVAPEHCSDKVLGFMGKPPFHVYETFLKKFDQYNRGQKQFVVPYFISGHPGCTLKDAIMLAEYIRDHGAVPDQVQDFYPTPGSIATAMYYTGLDPRTLENVHIPMEDEKQMQRALLQYNRPENKELVRRALLKAHRKDLIGRGPKVLLWEEGPKKETPKANRNRNARGKNKKRGDKKWKRN